MYFLTYYDENHMPMYDGDIVEINNYLYVANYCEGRIENLYDVKKTKDLCFRDWITKVLKL